MEITEIGEECMVVISVENEKWGDEKMRPAVVASHTEWYILKSVKQARSVGVTWVTRHPPPPFPNSHQTIQATSHPLCSTIGCTASPPCLSTCHPYNIQQR